MIQLGYNLITGKPIEWDMLAQGHTCIVGSTGSGKSVATQYYLYKLFKYSMEEKIGLDIHICDFKKSKDYEGISTKFAEFEEVTDSIEKYYTEFEQTQENNPIIKLLLVDEYVGYITWLTQNDKKKADEIMGKISNLLMLGRSRHCYVWSVQQRISASLYPTGIGAIDNYQICLGLGRLSVDSRKSLFAGEHLEDKEFEEGYHPKTGQGLILIDGQELQPIQIPHINDKNKLKAVLRKLAKECDRQ